MNSIVTLRIKLLVLPLCLLIGSVPQKVLAKGGLTLSAPLNIYSEVESLEPVTTLASGTKVQLVKRLDRNWVEISWEGQIQKPALARVSDLKKMLAAKRPAARGEVDAEPKSIKPVASRWSFGLGYQLGYQYQLPQTLSTPPLDGNITGFQGLGSGVSLYLDIPFAYWSQWRFEYQSYRHDMSAESLKHTQPPVKFRREKDLAIYHVQLKLYSFASKRKWHAPGLMYISPAGAKVSTDQGGSITSVTLDKSELTPAWGLSYSLGGDWPLGSNFVFSGQARAQVSFTEPATLGLQGMIQMGYLF